MWLALCSKGVHLRSLCGSLIIGVDLQSSSPHFQIQLSQASLLPAAAAGSLYRRRLLLRRLPLRRRLLRRRPLSRLPLRRRLPPALPIPTAATAALLLSTRYHLRPVGCPRLTFLLERLPIPRTSSNSGGCLLLFLLLLKAPVVSF